MQSPQNTGWIPHEIRGTVAYVQKSADVRMRGVQSRLGSFWPCKGDNSIVSATRPHTLEEGGPLECRLSAKGFGLPRLTYRCSKSFLGFSSEGRVGTLAVHREDFLPCLGGEDAPHLGTAASDRHPTTDVRGILLSFYSRHKAQGSVVQQAQKETPHPVRNAATI